MSEIEVKNLTFGYPDGFEMEPLVNPVVDLKKHPEKA